MPLTTSYKHTAIIVFFAINAETVTFEKLCLHNFAPSQGYGTATELH